MCVPGPFLCQRNPATTQSAVAGACRSTSPACPAGTCRRAAWRRPRRARALEPIEPVGGRGAVPASTARDGPVPRASPRDCHPAEPAAPVAGTSRRSSSPSASRSHATYDAGGRLGQHLGPATPPDGCGAGGTRTPGTPSRAMTTSPSRTHRSGRAARSGSRQFREVAVQRLQVARLRCRPCRRRGRRVPGSRPIWARTANRRRSAARRTPSRAWVRWVGPRTAAGSTICRVYPRQRPRQTGLTSRA